MKNVGTVFEDGLVLGAVLSYSFPHLTFRARGEGVIWVRQLLRNNLGIIGDFRNWNNSGITSLLESSSLTCGGELTICRKRTNFLAHKFSRVKL